MTSLTSWSASRARGKYGDRSAEVCDYPRGLLDQIKVPNAVYAVQFHIRRESGDYEVISGWRVHHSHLRTPVKPFELYLFIAVVYRICTYSMSRLARRMERRLHPA